MARSGPLELGVTASLRDTPLMKRDQAAAALARRYARLIDEASPAAKYEEPLRKIAAALDRDDEAAADAYRKIVTALSQHSVASDLGPKLLAALAACGMTPTSRNAKNGGAGGPVVSDELGALRARAQQRRRAGAH